MVPKERYRCIGSCGLKVLKIFFFNVIPRTFIKPENIAQPKIVKNIITYLTKVISQLNPEILSIQINFTLSYDHSLADSLR